jgi:hypothetical protein
LNVSFAFHGPQPRIGSSRRRRQHISLDWTYFSIKPILLMSRSDTAH